MEDDKDIESQIIFDIYLVEIYKEFIELYSQKVCEWKGNKDFDLSKVKDLIEKSINYRFSNEKIVDASVKSY